MGGTPARKIESLRGNPGTDAGLHGITSVQSREKDQHTGAPYTPKHKLYTPWTFWFDYQERRQVTMQNWEENLQKICDTSHVETFLYALKEMRSPSLYPVNSNIHFFRQGIRPMWEDSANSAGGKWVYEWTQSKKGAPVDQLWTETLLFCISEVCFLHDGKVNLDEKDPIIKESDLDHEYKKLVCGAVFAPRKNYKRISLWISVSDEKALHLGKMWKKFVGIDESQKISFYLHERALRGEREQTELYHT